MERRSELALKPTATEKLTARYLRKLSQREYIATASMLIIVSMSLLWMLLKIGGDHNNMLFADSMYAISGWIAAFWIFRVVFHARYGPLRLEPRHRLAWLLIATGMVANGIGGAWYAYLEWAGRMNPVPSLADAGFTIYYILTFLGLLLMPTAVKTSQSRIRIGLEAIMTTLCVLDISWFFSIRYLFSSIKDPLQLVVALSYPFWDVLLIFAILLLIYQRASSLLYPSLLICAMGVASQVWADTLYSIQIPAGTYTSGTWYIDTFWFLGALLIGLSAIYQYSAIARRVHHDRLLPRSDLPAKVMSASHDTRRNQRTFFLHGLPLYLPILMLVTLFIYAAWHNVTDPVFNSIAALIGLLLTARFLLANQENEILLQEREQRRAEADLLRQLSDRLTEEILLERLLTRVVSLATQELHFDAVTLLLIDDYERPPDAQMSLLIRAAPGAEVTGWRLEGERLPYCTVLTGKQIEVYWPDQELDLPKEIREWQDEQHILMTLFVPLSYQDKIQGSLGFSSRAKKHFSEHESYLAREYSAQAARAIEHAHVYEVAQNRECFAEALTAVAARLNSAAATESGVETEMFELICSEGARALQADYAVLYAPTVEHLQAVASYTSELEPPIATGDWPPLRHGEREAQSIHALQPTLLEITDMTTSGYFPAISRKLPALPAAGSRHVLSETAPLHVVSGSLRERKILTLRSVLARRNVQTVILAPLTSNNDAVALLVLARSHQKRAQPRRSFGIADLPKAQDFAEQAAIAFTNAQLYQQLREAHRQLQELDQLKDQFMITASHELRTPLTAVQGYLELLAQFGSVVPPEQQQEFLQKARRGCDELVLLLSNVMDVSRLEIEAGIRPAHLQPVNARSVIQDVITLVEPQITQQKREIFTYIPAQIRIKADPDRLRQVLLNLSSNALKYSEPGTPLRYTVSAIIDNQGQRAIISIADKGKGIKPQEQGQLFQRFVRLEDDLNSTVRGSGLGLYISRRLIEAMGGKIWVESSGIPGNGSVFSVQLPLA